MSTRTGRPKILAKMARLDWGCWMSGFQLDNTYPCQFLLDEFPRYAPTSTVAIIEQACRPLEEARDDAVVRAPKRHPMRSFHEPGRPEDGSLNLSSRSSCSRRVRW